MLKRILTIIFTLVLAVLFFFIIKINILPTIYFIGIIILVILFYLLSLYMLFKNNKKFNILAIILISIMMLLSVFSIYFINKTDNFISKTFNINQIKYSNTFLIIGKKDTSLDNKRYGYFNDTPNIEKALKEINYSSLQKYDDLNNMFKDLDKNIDLILIEKELYIFFNKDYKILKEFTIDLVEEIDKENNSYNSYSNSKDNINIYIGGTDFTNTLYDFNMIVSINKKTKNILLTSIPRDYHINIPRFNRKDNLGYIGAWGINETRKALEELFDIKINYYVKINTNSLVGVVNSIGGITYCSDFAFLTTHATILDSYDDSKGNKLYVKQGCHNYNGIEILTIARERYAFATGDRQRQKNCQQIMITIYNKIFSMKGITNYDNILSNLSKFYITNIPSEFITSLVKDKLVGNANWNIKTQSVNGYISKGSVHLTNYQDYIMIPDMNTIYNASDKIKRN